MRHSYDDGMILQNALLKEKFSDLLCWAGFVCSISSYLLLNLQFISATGAPFIILNCLAAIFIGYAAFSKKLNAVVAQNIAWFCITLLGAYRALVS